MSVVLPIDGRGILKPGGPQTQLPANFAVPFGLVGYWPFDADCVLSPTLTADLSGNGNHGTLTNSPTMADGVVGQSMSFVSGSQQTVACASLAALSGTVKCSILCWGKRLAASTRGPFVSQFVDSTHVVDLEVFTDGNFYASIGTLATNGFAPSNDANWHHFGMTYDGSGTGNAGRLKIYIDGAPQAASFTGIIPAVLPVNAGGFSIGRTVGINFTSGNVDEVRIYNRALDPWEVIQLHQAGMAGRRDAGQNMPQWSEIGAA